MMVAPAGQFFLPEFVVYLLYDYAVSSPYRCMLTIPGLLSLAVSYVVISIYPPWIGYGCMSCLSTHPPKIYQINKLV